MNSQRLVADFPPVPDCQNNHFLTIEMIENYVGSVPELDEPLAEFWWHLLYWTPDHGVFSQSLHALTYRRHSPLRCFTAFGSKKIVQASYINQRSL